MSVFLEWELWKVRGRKWTVEEERELRELVSEGHPVEVIARRFGKW